MNRSWPSSARSRCVVQAGVTRKQLNEHLRDRACSSRSIPAPRKRRSAAWRRRARPAPPPCATARCAKTSVPQGGDWPTARSSGRRGARASRRRATTSTRLLVGSEGTLGIITELTLRLLRHPRVDRGGGLPLRDASRARAMRSSGDPARHPGSRASSCSTRCRSRAVQRLLQARTCPSADPVPRVPRHRAARASRSERSSEIAAANGGCGFEWAERAEDRRRLWKARHDAYWAVTAHWPGSERSRPTYACRSRAWPNASRDPGRHRRAGPDRARSSGTSAMATSTLVLVDRGRPERCAR